MCTESRGENRSGNPCILLMATFPKLENHSVDSVMLVLLTSVASVWIFPTENVLFLINRRPHGCTISCIYPPCYSPNKPSLIYIPCMELSRAYSCFEMTHTFSNLICLIFSGETIFLATDVILNNGCWQQMKNSSFFFSLGLESRTFVVSFLVVKSALFITVKPACGRQLQHR